MIKGIENRAKLAVGVSAFAILIMAFQWSIIDWITPFLMMPLMLVVFIVFLTGLGFSISCLFKFKEIRWLATIPLAVQLVALAVLEFVPFTKLWINADFHLYESQRQEVVARVYSGELVSNVQHNSSLIALGSEYSKISMGGNEIVVQDIDGSKYVFFYTFRGILDNYSGFLYVPDGGDPRSYADLDEEDVTQIIKYADNWYYTSHH
ncbi:hypothetical protein NQU96_16485 [Pseudoalteromonas elyakovii]|jgi:hypothetical protein|uniref:hypothetical protein n=1 Tax=Pseudoalteromonas TaxID=53246 RepID=UPI000733A0BB|nr:MULTISPECIES: hypothetical protein [Pseudoalteromonas]KZY42845.1 hypothetical protein A3733_18985 [Pseudoalteromonas shioyasakiensis]MDC3191335.1 hypothetical protein [Pseudoalteromonas elyakovii]KTG20529.1 hypothetical protein AUR67_10185 [Pseudoalteromonas sp. XI10]KZY53901.1 hypothetical protein A3733_29210 [Pseudoalteromonas shioyasakiensis]TMO29473.1 hypothetical protein CWC28_06450 [Pseudoalteromonas sp. S4492]|tara:strand:- start:170 stop:790 length:621 start_codon:yes stop_codon:yes gene_type:complete